MVKFGYNCIQMWNKEKEPQGSIINKDDRIWKNLGESNTTPGQNILI